jgi:DNA anti-recombination protein RmuC
MCYIARQDDESARVLGLHRNLTSVLDSLLSLFHQGNARAENERRSAFVKEQQLQDDLRAQWDDLGANIDVAKEKMLSQYSDLDQVLQGILFSIQESVQQTFKDVQAQSTDVFERLSHVSNLGFAVLANCSARDTFHGGIGFCSVATTRDVSSIVFNTNFRAFSCPY